MLSGTKTRWLKQTITHYAATGIDDDGLPTYGSGGNTISCRIDKKRVKFLNNDGEVHVSTTQIITDGTTPISLRDKITLPDGSNPIILQVEENVDPDGNNHHTVIYT